MELEHVLRKHFFKSVDVTLEGGTVLGGYFIGIKLPVADLMILYIVPTKHADKYARLGNTNWLEQVPLEMVTGVTDNPVQDEELNLRLSLRSMAMYH